MAKKMTSTKGVELGIQNPARSCIRVENAGLRIPKICIHDYECWHCPFDQWIEEMEEIQESENSFYTETKLLIKAA